MVTKEEFFKNVDKMPKQVFSGKQRKVYTDIKRIGNKCMGKRESDSNFEIDLDALYRAYTENDKINTVTLLRGGYVTGRWRSPSIAIMMNAGLIDEKGDAVK